MKTILNTKTIPALTAGLGSAALLLRAGLYLLGTDDKGLLIALHPLNLLVWVVTAAALALTLLTVLPLEGSRR